MKKVLFLTLFCLRARVGGLASGDEKASVSNQKRDLSKAVGVGTIQPPPHASPEASLLRAAGYDVFSFRLASKYFPYAYRGISYTETFQETLFGVLEKRIRNPGKDPCESDFGIEPVTIPQTFSAKYTISSRHLPVSQWTSWDPCSVTCGAGVKRRRRLCLKLACNEQLTESQTCQSNYCSYWNEWSLWQRKSISQDMECDFRYRDCVSSSEMGSDHCHGNRSEKENCRRLSCSLMELLHKPKQWDHEAQNKRKTLTYNEEEAGQTTIRRKPSKSTDHHTCRFDEDFCGWSNTRSDNWELSAESKNRMQHNETGSFAQVSATTSRIFKPFRLERQITGIEDISHHVCVSFRYYVVSEAEASLSILVQHHCENEVPLSVLGHLQAMPEWNWNTIEFPVDRCSKIVLLAYLASPMDEIGVDDLTLIDGRCE